MQKKPDASRYVLLTEIGLSRLQAARRRYKTTVDDIIGDINTPSVNTVKRALRREAVFVSTLERLWDYFQRRAEEKGESLPYLVEGKDYVFTEGIASAPRSGKGNDKPTGDEEDKQTKAKPERAAPKQGWISCQVPRSNRLFTGRREALDRLHAALRTGPAALVADPQALTGLGGIGKTQTALAYIYAHWREYDYLFWVSAETVETLDEGLAALAEEMNLLAAPPATKKQALEKMHDWFRAQSDWLLVLDNVDDLERLAPYFPRYHTGHLLLTTRARNTVKWAAPINLAKLGPEEGALLLLRRAGLAGVDQSLDAIPADVAQAARNLCEELDGLPLALDQAGAYLAETASSVTDYYTLYRQQGLRLLDSTAEPEHASVTLTFTLALEQIAQRSLYGKAAVEMVQLCAFLSPDAIAEAIFRAFYFNRHNVFEAVCATVCGYSLAAWNPNSKTVSLHRLVQKVTRDTLNAQERRLWIGRAVQAVSDATPDFEYEDWPLCDLLLPQWRLCREYISEGNIETAASAYLLYQSGRYLRARALHAEAETCLHKAAAIAEKVHGLRHQTTADCFDELACLYRVLDRRPEAEALHTRAVEIMEQVEGADHFLTASKLHNMALLYIQYAEYAQAEIIFLRALAIYEKQRSPDYLLIATALTQLAGVYRSQSDFDKAEAYCRRALEIYDRLLEPEHIHIATACNNLALLYLTMARYEDAETYYLRALGINERVRGLEHPETGTVVWGLARVRWGQRRIEEADAFFRRGIGIYRQHFGPEHALSARIASNYAQFQEATARETKN